MSDHNWGLRSGGPGGGSFRRLGGSREPVGGGGVEPDIKGSKGQCLSGLSQGSMIQKGPHTKTYIHILTHTHTHARTNTHTTHTLTHTHIHTYIQNHTHTHTLDYNTVHLMGASIAAPPPAPLPPL